MHAHTHTEADEGKCIHRSNSWSIMKSFSLGWEQCNEMKDIIQIEMWTSTNAEQWLSWACVRCWKWWKPCVTTKVQDNQNSSNSKQTKQNC